MKDALDRIIDECASRPETRDRQTETETLSADLRERMARFLGSGNRVYQLGQVWVADDGENVRQI